MKSSRRIYAVALGAAGLVLVGSTVGAAAFAANEGPSRNSDHSWSQGTTGGMMGRWSEDDASDTPAVSQEQAAKIAADWAASNLPGVTLDSGLQMPMGYVFVASKDGKVATHVMVNEDTGEVFASNSRTFGGMMGRGLGNGGAGTTGGGMNGQGRGAGPSMMGWRSA